MNELTDPIRSQIDTYRPATLDEGTWATVGDAVRAWVAAAAPSHPRRARQLLAAGAQLAAWCAANNISLKVETALRATTIERYCRIAERDERHSATSRATIRSRLRYLARAHTIAGQPAPPPELRRGRVKPPYAPEEIARYFLLVRGQPEPVASRLEALLLAGLGAGCGSEEFRDLRGTDVIRTADGAVFVHLHARHERVVPVVQRYGARLHDLAADAGPSVLVGGEQPDRRAVTSRLLRRVNSRSNLPALEPGRLRSTWIVDRLVAGVRIDVLMSAAGLTTPTTIVDLAAWLPTLSESEQTQQLRSNRPDLEAEPSRPGLQPPDAFTGDCPTAPETNGRGA